MKTLPCPAAENCVPSSNPSALCPELWPSAQSLGCNRGRDKRQPLPSMDLINTEGGYRKRQDSRLTLGFSTDATCQATCDSMSSICTPPCSRGVNTMGGAVLRKPGGLTGRLGGPAVYSMHSHRPFRLLWNNYHSCNQAGV